MYKVVMDTVFRGTFSVHRPEISLSRYSPGLIVRNYAAEKYFLGENRAKIVCAYNIMITLRVRQRGNNIGTLIRYAEIKRRVEYH